jgi:DNA mismatch repair protein MutH
MEKKKSEIIIINELIDLLSGKCISDIINFETDNIYNKSAVSVIIRNYINNNSAYNIEILKLNNIRLKFISVNSDYRCFEALSFSHSSLYRIIFEDWSSSDLLEQPNFRKQLGFNYLFIPIVKIKKKDVFNNYLDWKIGSFSYWKPSTEDLQLIGEEWNLAKKVIQKGVEVISVKFGNSFRNKNNLPKQSETNFIHLRPHGKNSYDYDLEYLEYTNGNIEITKQSFWLNKKYINLLLKDYKWKINLKEE